MICKEYGDMFPVAKRRNSSKDHVTPNRLYSPKIITELDLRVARI